MIIIFYHFIIIITLLSLLDFQSYKRDSVLAPWKQVHILQSSVRIGCTKVMVTTEEKHSLS